MIERSSPFSLQKAIQTAGLPWSDQTLAGHADLALGSRAGAVLPCEHDAGITCQRSTCDVLACHVLTCSRAHVLRVCPHSHVARRRTWEDVMLTSIAGRSVIVTGASKGIGKGIAKVFCKNGGKVLVVSRNIKEAEACAEELRRAGGTARGCAADVTKIGDMQMLADTAAAVHGGIDILCANAGIFPRLKSRTCPRKTGIT